MYKVNGTNNNYDGGPMTASQSWTATKPYKKLMIFAVYGRITWSTSGDRLLGGPDGGIENYTTDISISGGGSITKYGSYVIAKDIPTGATITASITYPHPGVWQKPFIFMIAWEI